MPLSTDDERARWRARVLGPTTSALHGEDLFFSLGQLAVHPVGFYGEEAINDLYDFEVVFSVPLAQAPAVQAALGGPALIRLPHPGGARVVSGMVARVELLEPQRTSAVFAIQLVPEVWKLGRTERSRVFREMSSVEIVRQVLGEHGILHRITVLKEPKKRPWSIQYAESDLDFVLRLLREDGLCFFFRHLADTDATEAGFDRHVALLVLTDTTTSYQPIAKTPPSLLYRPDASGSKDRGGWAISEPLTSFRVRTGVEPHKVTLRDFEFERAGQTPGAPNPSPATSTAVATLEKGAFTMVTRILPPDALKTPLDLEVYDHRAEMPLNRLDTPRASLRLAQMLRDADTFAGSSFSPRLAPGLTFSLAEYPLPEPSGMVVITRIVHESHPAEGEARMLYANRFEAVRSEVLRRPAPPARRFVQALESATVVGTPGQEIETEVFGRVKIQFHWDRESKNDDRSSIWVRVAQTWSGHGYGFQFVPRIGMEVLVSFLGGDPDHPVVIGAMPNGANRLPYLLPQDISRSAIRTYSTPETGGYNEVTFVDKAGDELLALRAERDHEVNVLNDHRIDVGGDDSTTVAGRRNVRIGGDETTLVDGASRRTVGGALVDVIGGSKTELVGGTARSEVKGSILTTTFGSMEQTVFGHLSTVVGTSTEIDQPRQSSMLVHGEHRLAASKFLDLVSEDRIRLKVGDTIVEVSDEGISLRGPRIELIATEALTIKSPKTHVDTAEKLEIGAGRVEMSSKKGASVVLEEIAFVDGKDVLLKTGGVVPKPLPDGETPAKDKVVFQIDPPPGFEGPFTLVISTPTGKTVEVDTDADNKVELEGEVGDEFVLVAVKKGDTLLHQLGTREAT